MLVTGCAGFIGSHLCETLLQRGETVIGIDSITSYYSSTLKRRNLTLIQGHPKFIFLEADLVEMDLIPCLEQVDTVFHTAGQPGVRGSWGEQFDVYVRNNISATQRLLEAIRQTGRAIKIIYSSSSSIYGNSEQFPTPENALPRPYSPYGMTKLAGEHLCHLYYSNYQIPYVALRYFTVYGPRQRPDMAFHIFIRSVLREEAITILGDGNQTRDFTYVADIVQGNLLAAEKPVSGEVFNLGGGSRVTLREVLSLLQELMGKDFQVEYLPPSKGDVRDTSADIRRVQEMLGYEPRWSLREGLERQCQWLQEVYERG